MSIEPDSAFVMLRNLGYDLAVREVGDDCILAGADAPADPEAISRVAADGKGEPASIRTPRRLPFRCPPLRRITVVVVGGWRRVPIPPGS